MKKFERVAHQHIRSRKLRELKARCNRTERRAARRDPENAPTRRAYLGYWT